MEAPIGGCRPSLECRGPRHPTTKKTGRAFLRLFYLFPYKRVNALFAAYWADDRRRFNSELGVF